MMISLIPLKNPELKNPELKNPERRGGVAGCIVDGRPGALHGLKFRRFRNT